ncbi:MAG TPA: asparagine--tRNA ligase [Firmicutes bacterium]|nr:asparagine--tRNA ligase [Bacillota bacterium]HHY97352.1 asparagine--tRNA ligase [Bacillota bacterium]
MEWYNSTVWINLTKEEGGEARSSWRTRRSTAPNSVKRVHISDLGAHEGEDVEIRGWLYNRRSSGKIQFLQIRDGSGIVQSVLVKGEVDDGLYDLADRLTQESSVIIRGTVRSDRRAPGGYELALRDLEVVQIAEPYPIALKEHGIDFLLDHRHLWIRSPRQAAILKIRSDLVKAARDFLDDKGFVLLDAPILTPSACEGTTTLFETDYFDTKAYLTQSGQLYMEAGAMALGKVYCFGPTFRAEKSKTRRHLIEFWMLEPEMAYTELDESMELQEELISFLVQRILDKRKAELALLGRDISLLEDIKPPFPKITYDEAAGILRRHGVDFKWGNDFGGQDETIISNEFKRPVFVHRYPVECKAFYMKPDPARPEVALCADLLAPEGYGEIIGGGQRIDDPELLAERIKDNKLPEHAYSWYLDLRRYGSVPHSGFGLGIERTVAWICGLDHVRETIPFPRLLNRIYP